MADEQLTPLEEAKQRIEQSGYAGTDLEPYIVLIKRWDKEAEIHRFNPYMTVDGRVKEVKDSLGEDQSFSIRTFFNTGTEDRHVENIIVPARSCLAIFIDAAGSAHFGTASIGSTGMVDKTNPYENAETSAVGRALGLAGYGLIPGAGIASAEEVTGAIAREGASNGEDDWRSWSVSQLGQHKMPGRGWGKERKFPGWTFEEVYDDEDGHGAMGWAAGLDDPKGITAMMARYFNLREGKREEETQWEGAGSETDIPFDDDSGKMVLIAGKRVKANEQLSPQWAQWVAKQAAKNTGGGKLFEHQKHLTNHLKKHYAVAKIMDMTGRQAAALVRYMQSGGKDKDPAYYSSAEQDTEDLFGSQSLDDLLRKAAPNLAPPHDEDPQGWYKQICEMYNIGPVLNAKQLDSMRKILQLIATGTINLREIAEAGGEDDPMFRTLCESLTKVAKDGK